MVHVINDTDHASPFQYAVEISSLDEMKTESSQRLLRTGKERIKPKDGVRVQAVISPLEGEPGYKSFADGFQRISGGANITFTSKGELNPVSYDYWVIATLRVSRVERAMAEREGRAIEPKWVKCIVNPDDFIHLSVPLGRKARFISTVQHTAGEEEE